MAILVVLLVVLYSVMVTFVARSYLIPSEGMAPTLNVGDHIIVNKLTYRSNSPQPGDVIVFKGPPNVEHRLQVDPLRQHRRAVDAERAVVHRVRAAGRE